MNTIITIGRQFGSGGREIGEKVAQHFGIKFYDKELLSRAAKESGFCQEMIESHDERLIKQTAKYYERYKIVEDLTSIDDDILKVTICDFNGSENNSNNYFDEYRDKVQITVSGEIWLDIVAKGINKGVAINEIQNLLNIDYKETMVFGDYLNDLEMMSSAYHSYAMANAHDTLKKAARFIAKSNDENGVIQAIKSVAL